MLRKQWKCMLSGLLAVLMLVSTPLSVLAENSGSFRVETAAENSEKETENDAGAESSAPEEQEDQLPGEESGEPQEDLSGNAEQAPVASPSDAEAPEDSEKSVTTPSDARRKKGIKDASDFVINEYNGKLEEYNGTDTAIVIPENVKSIGSDAFQGNTTIVSVTFNAGLECVDTAAFKNCTNLETVDFSASTALISIESAAFEGCLSLEGLELNSAAMVRSSAFKGCTALATVVLPDGVTMDEAWDDGKGQFQGCIALTSLSLGEGLLSIPKYAFSGCTHLASVEIPVTVAKIGKNAFSGCSVLAAVEFPESVTEIGEAAYSGCTSLTSVELPEGIAAVGENAFKGCRGIESLSIESVSLEIQQSAFEGCSKLETVTSDTDGKIDIGFTVFKGCIKLTGVTLSQEDISIGQYAFSGCIKLADFKTTAADGVMTLKNYAFSGCTKLSAFETGHQVIFSDYYYDCFVFNNCTSVKKVKFGAGTAEVPVKLFYKCTGLQSVTLPSSVTSIGNEAFSGCIKLTSVTLGKADSLEIGSSAFSGCTALTAITLNTADSLEIGSNAFSGCTALTAITLNTSDSLAIEKNAFSGCTVLKTASLKSDVLSIGESAFNNCTRLASVSVNAETVTIGESAFNSDKLLKTFSFNARLDDLSLKKNCFEYCEALTSFTVPGKVSFVKENNWDGYQFHGCKALKTVSFESGSGVIPVYAFSDCAALTSIKLPSKITKIEERAFYECAALKAVSIPTTVTSIGEAAFSDCSALTATGIGSSHKKLTAISDYAFYNCKKLAEFTIPSGVTTVGSEAFRGCAALKTLTVYAAKMTIAGSAFRECTKLASVSLPKGVLMHEDGHQFDGCTSLKKVMIGTGITQIPKSAFEGCSSLTDVVLPKSVNTIGANAFKNCKQLINTGLETTTKPVIEEYAYYNCAKIVELTLPKGAALDAKGWCRQFENCTSLKKVTIGEGLTVIPEYAFSGCSALSEVSLPKSLKTIGYSAFGSCKALVDTGLEDTSVTAIGKYAYEHCDSLTDVRFPSTLVSIGYGAFYYGGLRSVTIPASVKTIGNYAFAQYPGKRIIYGYSGSYAQTYAKNNKITFVNIGSCYTVRFNGNGATSGYMGDVTNMPVSKEQALPSNTFKKTGYTFAGWTLSAKGSGKVYANKAKVKGLAKAKKSVTLYAKWKVNTYKVVLNPNGGTGKAKTVSMTYNKAAKLANPSFKKTGYTFVGWNTKANGKGTAYPATVSVKNLTATNGATVKLYAIWVKQSVKLSKVAKAATGSAKLTFSKSGTVTGYEIERSTKKTSGFKQVGTAKSSATSYTDTGLTKGTTYYYRVRTYYTYAGVKFYSAYSSVLSYKAQ